MTPFILPVRNCQSKFCAGKMRFLSVIVLYWTQYYLVNLFCPILSLCSVPQLRILVFELLSNQKGSSMIIISTKYLLFLLHKRSADNCSWSSIAGVPKLYIQIFSIFYHRQLNIVVYVFYKYYCKSMQYSRNNLQKT